MPGLGLEDDGEALALSFVTIGRLHAVLDMLGQAFAGWLVESLVFVECNLKFAIDQAQDGPIDNGLAEFLYQVQFERWFSRPVGVDKASIWVETCQNQSAFDLGVEDAIAVVQCCIEGIGGALRLTPRPLEVGQQEPPHAGPVAFGSTPFCCKKLQPDVITRFPCKSLGR